MGDNPQQPVQVPVPVETRAEVAVPPKPPVPDAIYLYPIPAGAVVLLLSGAAVWWLRLFKMVGKKDSEIARLNTALTDSAMTRGALADKVRSEKDAEIRVLREESRRQDREVKAALRAALAKEGIRYEDKEHEQFSTRKLLATLGEKTGAFRMDELLRDEDDRGR